MKSKRLCLECADTPRDGFILSDISELQVLGKCDICNRTSMLTTYRIESGRKKEKGTDDNSAQR